jgi:hypothetical protein
MASEADVAQVANSVLQQFFRWGVGKERDLAMPEKREVSRVCNALATTPFGCQVLTELAEHVADSDTPFDCLRPGARHDRNESELTALHFIKRALQRGALRGGSF